MIITLYSDDSPDGELIRSKLDNAGLKYDLITGAEAIKLNVYGAVLDLDKAIRWINAQTGA